MPATPTTIRARISPVGVIPAALILHEPFGLREFAALTVALGGVAVALRA
jgi:drug/metabolite transporter (DMT)-like permease